jgi:NAD(P)-dependent dehydrogenase (short-subunit alcohol dehydrogenase family)
MDLKNKVALITGGASGIGRATALLFAREGAAVAVADLDEAGGQETVRQITRGGGRAIFVLCNVTENANCKRAVRFTVEELGSLDILVNNAGIIRRSTIIDTTEEEWDRVMAVNVKSVFLLSKYAIPVMVKAGGNCICPGDTLTPMLKGEARQLGQADEQFLAEAAERPLGRIGKPEDIAQAALYLASDASAFITGTTLVVDGGGLAG